MAKFKYVGDPNDRFSGPDVAVHHGVTFRKNEVVEVDDEATVKHPTSGKELSVAEKLRGNSHFVDMSDKETSAEVEKKKKALEKAAEDKAKAIEAQRKADEKDEAERNRRAAASSPAAEAPRPPGTVTRPPVQDAFQGRPVEERTRTEDHTSAGKTKS